MILWPGATYLGPPDSNYSGPMVEVRGLVVHIAEGSYWGTIGWQENPVADVSSHFVFGLAGERAQMLDLNLTAWTQVAGNGHWLSVEDEGFSTGTLSAAQQESIAQLYAWMVDMYNVPLRTANDPNGRGLGWHGMGGVAWGNHPNCPGPNNVALLPRIIERARQILNGVPTPPEDDVLNAILTHDLNGDYIFLIPSAGGWRRLPKAYVEADKWIMQNALDSFTKAGMGVDQTTWAGNSYDFSDPVVLGQWGHELVPGFGGGSGGDGATPEQVRSIVRTELDGTGLGPKS